MSISEEYVYNKVINLLAKIKNINSDSIRVHQKLINDLGFNHGGLRALAVPLNNEFQSYHLNLKPDDIIAQITVNDLIDLVWNKIPNKNIIV